MNKRQQKKSRKMCIDWMLRIFNPEVGLSLLDRFPANKFVSISDHEEFLKRYPPAPALADKFRKAGII